VMAAFGAPTALEDHAERALHATLAMQRRLHELSDAALLLRIGVNTGDVVAGAPRASSSFVTGDAVNVAARLEQGADPGEILVGERTVALVRGAFEFGERRTIEAKGKPGGIACRPLLRALSLMRPRGVLGLHQAFVGRDDEMAILEGAFEGVTVDGRPRLITILGDAGVGKSRLVREFWAWLGGRSPEPLRRTGRCLSYGDGVTYWPLAEVLREQLGLADNASSSAILEVLGDREILGLTLGLDVAHGLHPLAARDRFQDAWVAFCEEVAAERPLVILIEDVHWAEDLLLDLLERLVSECRAPLLLLTTGRPEFLEMRPGWGSRLAGETVALDALSPDESARMLDELLGGVLPVGLRDIVIERAEGNPFFVEEVLGALIDLGLLSRDDDGWHLAELPAGFSVPDTVHALVAARVDLLEAADKQGLQAASVIGRIFWAGPVYELVAEGQPDLRVIEERDFIRRRSGSSIPGDREYAIKHAVTREVAYESLSKADRAHMHAAFARWLERIGAGGDEFASFLAHHYAEAVRPEDVDLAWPGRTEELQDLRERAVAKLRQAAELAIGRMEVDDALSLLERAIELETHPERLAELWHAVARASILKFDGEGFWKAIQSSLETTHDRAARGDLYADLGFQTSLRSGMWRTKPDEEMVRGWIERALELADPGTSARAKALLAKAFMDPKDSDDLAREALAIADRLDDVGLRSFAFNALDVAAFVRGDYEGSLVWCRERIALVPKLTDPDHIALIYGFSLPAFIALGRFDEAREIAQTFDDVSQRLSLHHRLHAAFEHVYVEASAGRWEAVGALTARTESAVMANAATPCVLEDFALLFCALALVHLGDDAEARRLEQVVTDLGRKGFEGRASTDVEIALARNDLPEVARLLDTLHPGDLGEIEGHAARLDALVALGRTSAIEEEAPALMIPGSYLEPFALRALGWAHGDDELLERAIDRFTDMGMEWYADQTKRWMSGAERR
jgi:tetratricopeptide (TPR) repeat protein